MRSDGSPGDGAYPGLTKIAIEAAKLALPIALGYLLVVGNMLFELYIVGAELGSEGVAAVGLGGTLAMVIILAFHAVELACQTIAARRHGEGNDVAAGASLDNALVGGFAISVPLVLLLGFAGPGIFGYSSSDVVRDLAFGYFKWRLPGIPFFIGMLAIVGFCNGIGRPKLYLGAFALSLVLNALLVHALVRGRLGLPRLGIEGAGMASSASALVAFSIMVLLLFGRSVRERYRCLHPLRNVRVLGMKSIVLLGLPIFVQQFFSNFGIFLFQAINSAVPDSGVSIAASTIARNAGMITYLPGLGFGLAAATLVSRHLGAGDVRTARRAGMVCWAMGAACMGGIGLCFVMEGDWLVGALMSSKAEVTSRELDSAVKSLGATLLLIIGLYQIPEAMNTILGKALQGSGATRFVMIATVAAQWLFFLPLAWLLALRLGHGALGAWIAFATQITLLGAAFLVVFLGKGWTSRRV